MKSKIIFFVCGFTFGVGLLLLLGNTWNIGKEFKYIQLKQDYKIEGAGSLSKGTILGIDQAMDEGFTRYILFLNLRDGEITEKYKTTYKDEIIPYWLMPTDSTK